MCIHKNQHHFLMKWVSVEHYSDPILFCPGYFEHFNLARSCLVSEFHLTALVALGPLVTLVMSFALPVIAFKLLLFVLGLSLLLTLKSEENCCSSLCIFLYFVLSICPETPAGIQTIRHRAQLIYLLVLS